VADFFYPRGGWSRAVRYVAHRLRRLPDPAHRISRGIAAGVFTCFTPFFGFHFLFSVTLAFVVRGNILAAVLATFFGNPLTFPVIATISVELGYDILGRPGGISLHGIVSAFSRASIDLWSNFLALFTSDTTNWLGMSEFFHAVFLPYLVGGLLPGTVAGLVAYVVSRPLIAAYKKTRVARMKKSVERRKQAAALRAARDTAAGEISE